MFEDALPALAVAGRLLLGGAFIFAGIRNIANRPLLTSIMTARGVPQAGLLLWAGIILQIVGGALLVSGLWTALGGGRPHRLPDCRHPHVPQFLGPSGRRARRPHQRRRCQYRADRRFHPCHGGFGVEPSGYTSFVSKKKRSAPPSAKLGISPAAACPSGEPSAVFMAASESN